jgi:hypothetical protein
MSKNNNKSLHRILAVTVGSSRICVKDHISELLSRLQNMMWSWTLQEIEIHVLEIRSHQINSQNQDLHKNQQVIYV